MNNFITKDRNDLFSTLRGLDLKQLLIEVEDYYLEYRNNLDLPLFLTFGVEIEYEDIFNQITNFYIKHNFNKWESKTDPSLDSGGEISSPILIDSPNCWDELLKICNHLKKRKANTIENAGGHIHVGANVLGDDVESWKQFIKINIIYEHILSRFLCGDKINGRRDKNDMAGPISAALYRNILLIDKSRSVDELFSQLPTIDRCLFINFINININDINSSRYKNTYEFRGGNATDCAIVWQNSINAITKLSLTARNKLADVEFLNYKLNNEYRLNDGNEYLYDCIILKDVLEFVDINFDNNLDKVYFLRQYLKSFQERFGVGYAVKAKKFVRK